MSRLSLAAPLFLAAVAFGPMPSARQQVVGDRQPLTENHIRHEPVLLLERSGGTLMGPVQQTLVIYNDGRACMSSMRPQPGLAGPELVQLDMVDAGLAAVHDLAGGLIRSGAFGLTDQENVAFDVPLTTVTVFKGETDAGAHTFSYWIASDEFENVEAVIDRFTQVYFPAF